MNNLNLQEKFPLSPKKYWKKMISQILAATFVGVFLAVVTGFVYFAVVLKDINFVTVVALVIVAFVFGFLLLTIPYSIYVKAYIKRYYYSFDDHLITIKKGVFTPAEIHVQYQKIQDVYVDQDLLDRMMGLYDVHIASATMASGIEAHIDGVEKAAAEGLKEFLLGKLSGISAVHMNQGQNNGQNQGQNATIPLSAGTSGANMSTSAVGPITVNLPEEISSTVYPLSGKWMAIAIIGRIISAFFFGAVIVFAFFAKVIEKTSTPDFVTYMVLAWIGLSIVIVIWNLISLSLWKKNYAFKFTPENIYYKGGVISISEKHMPYSSVQDVTVAQGILERFVGLATIRIENAATQTIQTKNGRVAVFTGVIIVGLSISDANKITNIIKTTVLGRNTSKYGL